MRFIAMSMVFMKQNISKKTSYIVGNKKFFGKICILNLRHKRKSNHQLLRIKEDCKGSKQNYNYAPSYLELLRQSMENIFQMTHFNHTMINDTISHLFVIASVPLILFFFFCFFCFCVSLSSIIFVISDTNQQHLFLS